MIVRSIASNNEKLLIYREEDTSSSSSVISLWKQSDSCQIGGYIRIGERCKIRIGGYPVYSVKNQMEFNALVDRKGIKTILFTDYHVVKAESERLVRYCEKKKIRMLVFSAMNELKSRTVNLHNLPEIRIEDLLGRDEININLKKIAIAVSCFISIKTKV